MQSIISTATVTWWHSEFPGDHQIGTKSVETELRRLLGSTYSPLYQQTAPASYTPAIILAIILPTLHLVASQRARLVYVNILDWRTASDRQLDRHIQLIHVPLC